MNLPYRLFPLVFCGVLSASAPAMARSAYFVQLGSAESEGAAEARWKELSAAYPALLSPLEYAPRTVISDAGGVSEFRIQAGPARSRDQARRICASLVAKDVECYLVETAVFGDEISVPRSAASAAPVDEQSAGAAASPITAMTDDGPATVEATAPSRPAALTDDAAPSSTPDRSAAPEIAAPASEAPATEERSGFAALFPWLVEDPKPAIAPETLAMTDDAPKGEVAVAEAIRVPLSKEKPAEQEATPEQQLVAAPSAGVGLSVRRYGGEAGKQEVFGFTTEQEAYLFSRELRKQVEGTRSLRIRVTRSLSEAGRSVSLRISPIREEAVATRICDFAATYAERPLTCAVPREMEPAEPAAASSEAPNASPSAPPHSELAPSSGAQPGYFVQLGAWRTPKEAEQRWKRLTRVHPPLADQPHSTSEATGTKRRVALRAGPFPQREAAETLCNALTERRISCRVD